MVSHNFTRALKASSLVGLVVAGLLLPAGSAWASGTYPTLNVANIREAPTTNSEIIKTVPKGAQLTIDCYSIGESVGGVTLWNHLTSGGFISDTLLLTGSDGPVVPQCLAQLPLVAGPDRSVTSLSGVKGVGACDAWSRTTPGDPFHYAPMVPRKRQRSLRSVLKWLEKEPRCAEGNIMIRRITSIQDFQAFKNWRSPSGAKPFSRVNLIYGTNGSGKSTLAKVLAAAAAGDADNSGVVLEVSNDRDDGGTRRVDQASDPFWRRVRVFNTEYVRRSLRFEDGEANPLLVLGPTQVDAEERLTSAQARIHTLEAALPEKETQKRASETAVSATLRNVAARVVEDLHGLQGRYRGTNYYTARQVREILDGDRHQFAEQSTDLIADLDIVTSLQMPSVQPLRAIGSTADLVSDIESALQTSATGHAIERLRQESGIAHWVQSGMHLHREGGVCEFCGNSISSARWAELQAHFDDSVRVLQETITTLQGRVASVSTALLSLTESIPEEGSIYTELADGLTQADSVLRSEVRLYEQYLDHLEQALAEKRSRLFESAAVALPERPVLPDVAALNDVIAAHNQRSSNFESARQARGLAIEYKRIADAASEYDTNTRLVDSLAASIQEDRDELAALRADVTTLSSRTGDPLPLADQLTRDLSRLLGRQELTFLAEGDRYLIQRNGYPATGLSEGEKTAISLLYFLCSLNEQGAEPDLVVVIDDPVSSLDSNVLVGASAHLWSELVHDVQDRQLILLTHNFELFRIWSNQLDGRYAPPNTVRELRMVTRVGSDDLPTRVPVFSDWPADDNFRRKTRSEYHYLFWRVASTLQESAGEPDIVREIEAMALLPNAARKVLEAFLSFKYPQFVGSFEQSVSAALSDQNDPMKERVVRFLHHHSHNAEGDTSAGIQPGEAVAVLSAVFELISLVDHEHFEAMCSALGLDSSALVTV